MDKVVKHYPSWLEAVRTRSSWKARSLILQIDSASQEVAALDVRLTKLEDDLKRRRQEAKSNLEAVATQAQPKSDAPRSEKVQHSLRSNDVGSTYKASAELTAEELEEEKSDVEKQKKTAEERLRELTKSLKCARDEALKRITNNTRLSSLKERLEPKRLDKLLKDVQIEWSRFGDSEAFALRAWADVLGNLEEPDASAAAIQLRRHILRQYYPEEYDTLSFLLASLRKGGAAADGEIRSLEQRILFTLGEAYTYDPDSTYYRWLQYTYYKDSGEGYFNSGRKAFDEKNFKRAAEFFELAAKKCDSRDPSADENYRELGYASHEYYGWLAEAWTEREHQLCDDGNALSPECGENRKKAIDALKDACYFKPSDRGYQDSLVSARSRHYALGQAVDLERSGRTYLIEVQFSLDMSDVVLDANSSLNEKLLSRITELRGKLKEEFGIPLPGVTFRDSRELRDGRYRVLIRDVPFDERELTGEGLEVKRTTLVKAIESVVRANAAEFYDVQDVINQLAELKAVDDDYREVANDGERLVALTQLVRGLLAERVPLKSLKAVAEEYDRGRLQGLDLVEIGERIRLLPEIRELLPGNGRQEGRRFFRIGAALGSQITDMVDTDWPGLFLKSDVSRAVALSRAFDITMRKIPYPRETVLVTSVEARLLARKLVEPGFPDVSVLSEVEIFPSLIGRVEDDL